MIIIEDIISACAEEIAVSERGEKGLPVINLVKEGDIYRALSKIKLADGEYLFSAKGVDDQNVTIEYNEGMVFVSGIDSAFEVIPYATVHQDKASFLKAIHGKLCGLKASDEVVKDPFFIVGPPGTGKTKVITKITEEVILAIKAGERILICSQTNMAVENVFEKLDFEALGLAPGDALLTVKTENHSLLPYSLKAVADLKIKPIDDELELLEAAMVEILKSKRDEEAMLSALSSNDDSVSITLSNLARDEVKLKEGLKASQSELKSYENRLALIGSNKLVQSVATAYLGTKIAEIEAGVTLSQNQVDSFQEMLDEIGLKKETLTSERIAVNEKLVAVRSQVEEANASAKEVSERIEVLKKEKINLRDLNLFGAARLVGTTLMSAALNRKINEGAFDKIIIDESSMASLPVLALACKSVKISDKPLQELEEKTFEGLYEAQSVAVNRALKSQFIFVGDPKQLSPIAKTAELKKSVFEAYGVEKIFEGEAVKNAILLDINFRNHPDIVVLTSRLFYGGLLKSGRKHDGKKSLYIRNTKGTCSSSDGSYVNHMNAMVVYEQTALALSRGQRSIGVITPYRKQAENIESRLNVLRESYQDEEIQTGTVYKFQGKEKAVVMFDVTASSGSLLPATYTGDIKSEAAKLLNVATTRAEDFFVLVGDIDGLERQMKHIPGHESMALWLWIDGIKELAYAA
jgi:superfamily I DNA and/or RNA helicase